MDLIKIGNFISLKRKEKGITQSELAEKLGVSDRAVSKWENGICLPDACNMSILCKVLNITINDLFSGEVVDMKDNEKRLEQNLLEMTKAKEESDKRLLNLEILIGVLSSIILFSCVIVASILEMDIWLRIIIIVIGFIIFTISMFYALKIEQVAGYYECSECHHKYVPSYRSVNLAMHMGRTRRMKCPKCGKKSWQKKVLR